MCSVLVFSACSRPGGAPEDAENADANVTEKKDYFVEVESLGELSTQPTLRKTGKLTGKSDVTVSAQSSGRISKIFYEEGENPARGAKVVSLTDSNNLYNFSASRNKESVEAARLNYDSTRVNLDNSLIDLELAVTQAQQQYDTAIKEAEKVFKDNEQQLLDAKKQIEDNELQLLDAEKQKEDNKLQLLDSQQQIKDAEQQRILAEYSSRTNDPDDLVGSARIQLDNFDADIQKAEFDLQTRRDADQQTLEWFVNSVGVIQDTIENVFETTLDGIDKILGVTPINATNNDLYEDLLWAQDTRLVREAEESLRALLAYNFNLANFSLTIENIDQMPGYLRQLDDSLDLLDDILQQMERILGNTITSNLFTQGQLDGLKAQIDGYQSQVVGQAGSVVTQINAIDAFLATFQQNQESTAKSIENLRKQRTLVEQQLRDAAVNADIAAERADIGGERTDIAAERSLVGAERTDIAAERSVVGIERVDISIQRTIIALERANLQAENAIESAALNLQSAKNALAANQRTRDISLLSLQNGIDQAQVGYSEALANSSKLSVLAPISWSIWEILVDEGEEVNNGTPLFTMTTTQDQEITITLSSEEKDQISVGTIVTVTIKDQELDGTIVSISDIADDQLLYKTTIVLNQLSDRIGEIVDVEIPLTSTYVLVPLQAVTMQTSKQWSLWVRNGEEPESVQVDLWEVRGKSIEIKTPLGEGINLITSPMANYDRNVHDAKEKKEIEK